MRVSRGPWTLIVLLIVAGFGLAQSPDGPPIYEDLRDTQCWTCHKPGAYDPAMDPYVYVLPEFTELSADQEITLPVRIKNVWEAPKGGFELMDFRVTLDLRRAPSFSFVSDTPPIDAPAMSGEIPFDPTAAQDPNYFTQEHRGFVVVQVPQGATDIVLTLRPTNDDPNTGPDLSLRIYPGQAQPGGDAARTINDAGRGQAERFQANSPDVFGEFGFGNWTIEAGTRVVDTAGQALTPSLGPIPFEVKMDAWFNASAEVQQVVTSDDLIVAPQQTLVDFRLKTNGLPTESEVLGFTVNLTTHYEHDDKSGATPNWQDLTYTQDVPIELDEAGVLHIGSQGDVGTVIIEPASAVSLSRISEIIGYVGAFLLISSVWTGGMFGKASRRQLNTLFGSARRRVAFHNFLSYGIIAFAAVHTFIFMWDVGTALTDGFHWLVGVLFGGPAILAMLLLGVTGALQVPMIRRWNYATWRWSHLGLAIAAIVFTLVHMYLDGTNFADLREPLGWKDPIVPTNDLS